MPFNALRTIFSSGSSPPMYANVLAEAVESGVLILPFQNQVVISI
jgi:capsid protein